MFTRVALLDPENPGGKPLKTLDYVGALPPELYGELQIYSCGSNPPMAYGDPSMFEDGEMHVTAYSRRLVERELKQMFRLASV